MMKELSNIPDTAHVLVVADAPELLPRVCAAHAHQTPVLADDGVADGGRGVDGIDDEIGAVCRG